MEKVSAPAWQTGTSHGSRLAAARAKSVKTEINFEGGGGWRRIKMDGGARKSAEGERSEAEMG